MWTERIDMTGKRFGKLLVISEDTTSPRNELRWICICDCGKLCSKRGTRLRSGQVTHCGCENIKMGRPPKFRTRPDSFRSLETKYGCLWCADYDDCKNQFYESKKLHCKYAEIIDKYGDYRRYDRAAMEDFYSVVSAFPPEIEME